jgi:signal transduction histidine kinase
VDVDALVGDILERYPEVSLEGRAGSVLGDPNQLAIALTNLLDNALRHGLPPVQIVLGQEGGRVLVGVSNAGPAISPANLPQIFDRFFTTDREHGTGLGLALVRVICRAHGGDVSAESESGRTSFVLSLPRG